MQINVLPHWNIRRELAVLEDLLVLSNDEFVESLTPFAHEHLGARDFSSARGAYGLYDFWALAISSAKMVVWGVWVACS